MVRSLFVGILTGAAEALTLHNAGYPGWAVFLGYSAAGSLGMLVHGALVFWASPED